MMATPRFHRMERGCSSLPIVSGAAGEGDGIYQVDAAGLNLRP